MIKGKILAGHNKHYAEIAHNIYQGFFDGDVVEILQETPDRYYVASIPRASVTWIDSEFIEIIKD